jgi:hypothetical protein
MRLSPARPVRLVAGLVSAIVLFAGCADNGGGLPRFNGSAVAAAAMSEYDKNGDGTLDAKELANCPGLKALSSKLAKPTLTADDLTSRLAASAQYPDQLFDFPCYIWLDGRPLANAEVTLAPEKFMGERRKPAKGTTDDVGAVRTFKVDGLTKTGVPPGVYRLQVSKAGPAGEMIPAKFNIETTLGCEVGPIVAAARGSGTVEDPNFRLTSR